MAEKVQIVVDFNDENEHQEINNFLDSKGFTHLPKQGSLPRAPWVWIDLVNKTYRIGIEGVSLGFNVFERRITLQEMLHIFSLLDLTAEADSDYCKALTIAAQSHKGQYDKVGKDYLFHPLTVSSYCKTKKGKIVGLLHDVVEDTPVTIEELSKVFDSEITTAIQLLTKTKGFDINEYYAAIKNNPLAREVKMADLTHNMDMSRFDGKEITEKDKARAEKYKGYYAYLSE